MGQKELYYKEAISRIQKEMRKIMKTTKSDIEKYYGKHVIVSGVKLTVLDIKITFYLCYL